MSILRFFPVLILLVISFTLSGQPNNQDTLRRPLRSAGLIKKDTSGVQLPNPFIRIGVDVSSFARQIIENEVRQLEFSIDSEVRKNYFVIAELGFLNINANRESYIYKANGFFARAGIDFNLLKKTEPINNDLGLIGIRYAYSYLSHEAPEFAITNPYWGNSTGSLDNTGYYLHWIELSGGLKTEVLKNLYLGWNLKTRFRLFGSSNPGLDPYYVPGFGHSKRRIPVMIHYSLLYRFNLK